MRYFNTYLLVITANALKYKYTRLREYITVSDVVTCIGVITPVYYPSLVLLAAKSRDFLGLEMYAYEHTYNVQKMPMVHTHTKAWVHAVGCTKRQKKEDYPASCTKRQKRKAWKEARSRIRTKVAGFKVQNDNQLHQSSAQHASSPNLKNIFLHNSPKQQQFSFQKTNFFFTSSSSSHFCFFIRCGVVSNNNQ